MPDIRGLLGHDPLQTASSSAPSAARPRPLSTRRLSPAIERVLADLQPLAHRRDRRPLRLELLRFPHPKIGSRTAALGARLAAGTRDGRGRVDRGSWREAYLVDACMRACILCGSHHWGVPTMRHSATTGALAFERYLMRTTQYLPLQDQGESVQDRNTATTSETSAPAAPVTVAPHAPASTSGSADASMISMRGVRQVFNNDVEALQRVDLDIPAGQFVALVGASGCGKTTLLNMLAGLIAPTEGDILIEGKAPSIPNLDIGYMFARDALLSWRRADANVELPLEVRGWNKRDRRKRSHEMLAMVGLEGREKLFRLQLSQGMRQRVAIARTLVSDPDILLMDEPFAALDARTKLALQSEFLRIWEQAGGADRKTVLFVTHDLNEAALLADRVIVMLPHPGRIAEDRVIDLPRPRADILADVMFSDEFQATTRSLFERLEGSFLHAPGESDPRQEGAEG
jgi:NitT/TauT family transport system ATP-binding protein